MRKMKKKGVSLKRWIRKRSHRVQNHLVDIKLQAREYDMNKTSRRLANLSMVSRRVGVGEKGSK